MYDACILFAHHRNDEVTRKHFSQLRRLNPYPVVALRNQSDDGIEGAIRPAHGEHPWRGADRLIYSWFARREFDAARYIFLEWDCLVTIPIRDYYADVWHEDAVSSDAPTLDSHPEWEWFTEVAKLPPDLRPYASGLRPLNGVMLSHAALTKITSKAIPDDIFCELRLGTLIRSCGFKSVTVPNQKGDTNCWAPDMLNYDPSTPSLYHPVKSLDPGEMLSL